MIPVLDNNLPTWFRLTLEKVRQRMALKIFVAYVSEKNPVKSQFLLEVLGVEKLPRLLICHLSFVHNIITEQ